MRHEFNDRLNLARALSVPLIGDMYAQSRAMNQAFSPFIAVEIKDQDPMKGVVNENAPLRVIDVLNPDDRNDLYARVTAFSNQNGNVDFLVYDKKLDDPVVMGSADEIKPVLSELVKGRIEERNMALVARMKNTQESGLEI